MSEAEKARQVRHTLEDTMWGESYYSQYIQLPGLDIGYRGYEDAQPIYGFTGLELGEQDYDGETLPYPDGMFRTVHASHVLEHCELPLATLQEWFRVVALRGHLIITVPHKFLYEKKKELPSKWNADHRRFYTPGSLLTEIENALTPNTYRVIYCRDNAWDFDYSLGPDKHSSGMYEIECILQKIEQPKWKLL